MRTTLTIDDDVAAVLNRLRKTGDQSYKELVNEALRRGLGLTHSRSSKHKRVYTRVADLGRCLIGDISNIGEVLAIAEGEDYK